MILFFVVNSPTIESGNENNEAVEEAIRVNALIEGYEIDYEIKLANISDQLLELVIRDHIGRFVSQDEITTVPGLEGGLRIEYQNKAIYPQCCGEVSDYINWAEILREAPTNWKEIWIGHPCIYYRVDKGRIYLSDYYEPDGLPDEVKVKFDFNRQEFSQALAECLKKVEVFKQKIEKVINRGNFPDKEVLINGLVI